MQKGFFEYVNKYQPDILCIQETKAHLDQVDDMLEEYEHHFWNSAEKKGYSGVAVFSKIQPKSVRYGIGIEKHDREGRVLTVEYDEFFLVNVYVPNSKRGLLRLDYRHKEWDVDFLKYLKNLEKNKPVIFCGDLNVAHKEIDLANPKNNRKNAGFTDEEREGFDNLVNAGFIDTFREFNKEGGNYTWWSYMFNARAKNIGWRIDYFCISPTVRKNLQSAAILNEIMGSDHCPVEIKLKF